MSGINRGAVDTRGFDKEFTRWTVPNVETLSGNKTITSVDARVQLLNPGGANRTVTLDASLHVEGTVVDIHATNESAYYLDVKNSAATLIARLIYDQSVKVVYASGAWRIINLPFTSEYGSSRESLYVGYRYGVTDLHLSIGSAHKAWIDSTGFGVGNSPPSSLFHVTAAGDPNALRVDNTSGNTSFGSAPSSFKVYVSNTAANNLTAALVNASASVSAGAGLYLYSDAGSPTGYIVAWSNAAAGYAIDMVSNIGDLRFAANAASKGIYLTPGTGGRVICQGTTSAFRPNVLTTTQRDALTPVNGDFIFNSTTGKHEGYNGAWNACY